MAGNVVGQRRYMAVGPEEHAARRDRLRDLADRQELQAVCIYGSTAIQYFTGFAFQPTERPVAWIHTPDGLSVLVIPELERDHVAHLGADFDRVISYPEYPGVRHPSLYLKDSLMELGLAEARVGADRFAYGRYWGSRGPDLPTLLPNADWIPLADEIDDLRVIKSEAEVAALRESARLGDLAHDDLIYSLKEGQSELVLSLRASADATARLLSEMPAGYAANAWGGIPGHAGIKAGPDTAFPHPMGTDRALRRGDHVNTWALISVDGYRSELERTLFYGTPNDKQISAFADMLALQNAAFEALRPGVSCSAVDEAVLACAESRGILDRLRHHTGHALGLESHELPFLDTGESRLIEPGMVFSVEPGVYIPGLGGFRHSDTVVIHSDGVERITASPRSLEECIVG